ADLDAARPGWLELVLSIAAPAGDRAFYDRITAAYASTKRDDLREALSTGLGSFGATFAKPTIEAVARGDLPWAAAAGYFEHPATRLAAWRAMRDHLGEIMARSTGDDAAKVVEAVATICDATSRAQIAAAFEPRIAAIPDGRHVLDRVLAEIDRCVVRRTRAGEIAHALD
ncbi:MAG TPA: hypothetical protein VGM90_19550, partial [Kofleriaceae bacterium]